jgi:hypothetical protein
LVTELIFNNAKRSGGKTTMNSYDKLQENNPAKRAVTNALVMAFRSVLVVALGSLVLMTRLWQVAKPSEA